MNFRQGFAAFSLLLGMPLAWSVVLTQFCPWLGNWAYILGTILGLCAIQWAIEMSKNENSLENRSTGELWRELGRRSGQRISELPPEEQEQAFAEMREWMMQRPKGVAA